MVPRASPEGKAEGKRITKVAAAATEEEVK